MDTDRKEEVGGESGEMEDLTVTDEDEVTGGRSRETGTGGQRTEKLVVTYEQLEVEGG